MTLILRSTPAVWKKEAQLKFSTFTTHVTGDADLMDEEIHWIEQENTDTPRTATTLTDLVPHSGHLLNVDLFHRLELPC